MLPRHGVAFSVFLLAHSARHVTHPNVGQWVDAARAKSSYLAAAVDLETPAHELLRLELALDDHGIKVSSRLLALAGQGDRKTLLGIACLLLGCAPPVWLHLAISQAGVLREYIPDLDLQALEWLEPDLDDVLSRALATVTTVRNDAFRERMGGAAESLMMAAFQQAGMRPIQVSQVSDAYGYDIEIWDVGVGRIEVKAAGPKTRGSFYLTRNEFETSRTHGAQWRIVQVVFTGAAFLADELDPSHVEGVYELSGEAVGAIVPQDTAEFRWSDSALLTPPEGSWQRMTYSFPPNFVTPGFGPIQDVSVNRATRS